MLQFIFSWIWSSESCCRGCHVLTFATIIWGGMYCSHQLQTCNMLSTDSCFCLPFFYQSFTAAQMTTQDLLLWRAILMQITKTRMWGKGIPTRSWKRWTTHTEVQDSAVVLHILSVHPAILSTFFVLGCWCLKKLTDFPLLFFYILLHIVQPENIVWNNFCLRPWGTYCMSFKMLSSKSVCFVVKITRMFTWGMLSLRLFSVDADASRTDLTIVGLLLLIFCRVDWLLVKPAQVLFRGTILNLMHRCNSYSNNWSAFEFTFDLSLQHDKPPFAECYTLP